MIIPTHPHHQQHLYPANTLFLLVGWKSWKISYFLNWAGKPILFSDREAGKVGISIFEILKTSSIVFLEWFKKKIFDSVK